MATGVIVCWRVPSSAPLPETGSNSGIERLMIWMIFKEPPKTAFRSWVDGGSSVFGVDDFMAASFVGIFLTFDPLSLIGFWSLLVLIFAVQAARVNNFRRTILFVAGQVVDQVDQPAGWHQGCPGGRWAGVRVWMVCPSPPAMARAVPHQRIPASAPIGKFSWHAASTSCAASSIACSTIPNFLPSFRRCPLGKR